METEYYMTGVSIHAPTRGATENDNDMLVQFVGFNPRTHAGCDYISFA